MHSFFAVALELSFLAKVLGEIDLAFLLRGIDCGPGFGLLGVAKAEVFR